MGGCAHVTKSVTFRRSLLLEGARYGYPFLLGAAPGASVPDLAYVYLHLLIVESPGDGIMTTYI